MNPFKSMILIPFRALQRLKRWFLSEPIDRGSLQFRYPKVQFENPQNISVGARVFIGADCLLIAKSSIAIGDDTMIAPRVIIATGTHDPAQNPMWKIAILRPVSIGEHVWIGAGAMILPGVKIGDHAIIGAGAVVSKHVPDRAVVVGNPARIIRIRDIPELDKDVQGKYPYWEDRFEDYLPSDQITKFLEENH